MNNLHLQPFCAEVTIYTDNFVSSLISVLRMANDLSTNDILVSNENATPTKMTVTFYRNYILFLKLRLLLQ